MIILGWDIELIRPLEQYEQFAANQETIIQAKQILESTKRMVDLAEEAIREETGPKDAHELEDSPKFASGLRALNMAMVEEAIKLESLGEPVISKSLLECGEEQLMSVENQFAIKVKRDFIQPLKKFLKRYGEEFEIVETKLNVLFDKLTVSCAHGQLPMDRDTFGSTINRLMETLFQTGEMIIRSAKEISDCASKFSEAQIEYYRESHRHDMENNSSFLYLGK